MDMDIKTGAVAVLWVLSMIAAGVWQRHDGAMAERLKWQERETQAAQTAALEIDRLQTAARQAEHEHGLEMAAIGMDYERRLRDVEKRKAADRAAVSAGALRLYDRPPGLRADACGVSSFGSSPGRGDGRTPSELSGAAAGFLLDLANDADAVAGQLAECQAVIRADRQ
jgi:hypothetical protein